MKKIKYLGTIGNPLSISYGQVYEFQTGKVLMVPEQLHADLLVTGHFEDAEDVKIEIEDEKDTQEIDMSKINIEQKSSRKKGDN